MVNAQRPLFAIFLLCAMLSSADLLEHSELFTSLGYGYATHNNKTLSTGLELSPLIVLRLNDFTTARLSGRVRADFEDIILPGKPNLESYSSASRPYAVGDVWLVELRDAFINIRLDKGVVRLGKQQIVWGTLDGIKVLDALNPQSFERFILEDFDASRIGLWSAYLDLSFGNWRTELVLIPDTSVHYIPEKNAWFEFTAPRFRFGQTNNAAPNNTLVIRAAPEDQEGNLGIRLSRRLGGVDLQLVAISGLDFESLGRIGTINHSNVVETYHQRRELFGFSAEGSLSAFALRAEVSLAPKRAFNTRNETGLVTTKLDQWRGAIGLDITAPFAVFLNIQYLHDHVRNGTNSLIRPVDDRIITVFAKRKFMYDSLNIELRWYESLEDRDRLLRVHLSYDLNNNSSLHLKLDNFSGNSNGTFGQFDERDLLTMTWEHTF